MAKQIEAITIRWEDPCTIHSSTLGSVARGKAGQARRPWLCQTSYSNRSSNPLGSSERERTSETQHCNFDTLLSKPKIHSISLQAALYTFKYRQKSKCSHLSHTQTQTSCFLSNYYWEFEIIKSNHRLKSSLF